MNNSINNKDIHSDSNVKNSLKGTLGTSNFIKRDKKEIENIQLNNSISFLENNLALNSQKTHISNTIKENKNSHLKSILEEKDKIYEEEYKNKKQPIFLTNALYEYNKNIINCSLLLKNNELYILNKLVNEPLFMSSEKDLILDNIKKNINYYNYKSNDKSLIEENKLIIIEKSYNLSNPLFFINFDLLSCSLFLHKKSKWINIIILGYNKSINIYIPNKEKYDKFLYLINGRIFNSEGYKTNLFELSLRKTPIFIRHNFISLKEFESTAKTGDLLLFKSRFCGSKFQRLLSGDNYDHIGLFERKYDILSIYQSSLNGNIGFLFWDSFIDNSLYLYYDLVTYRRLNIEAENEKELKKKQKELENKFENFVQDTKKKKYYLSIKKLIFCSDLEENQAKGEWDKVEGFSCSSLAIAFYIQIGAIKYEKNIHSVRPGDFQYNKDKLTFNDGFSFGPERIIEFSD